MEQEESVLTLASLNICGQTGLTAIKQRQIQDFISQYQLDILSCQEINIVDESFSECHNISSNFTIIPNNAVNKYGTALFVSNSVLYENVVCDTDGRVIAIDFGDLTISNVYLHSGNDRISRNNRENALSETLPQVLHNRKRSGLCLGDFNCILHKKDATRNQADKIRSSNSCQASPV